MRDDQVSRSRLLAVGVAVCMAACCFASPALASAPTVTIEGSGRDGYSPSSTHNQASVDATLSAGVATGTLTTSGGSGGLWHEFKGTVTCMVLEGAHVTIGALGKDREVPNEGPPKAVSGEFAQLLTVEFGEFTDFTREELPTYTDRFGQMLGTHDEGVEASVAPNCGEAGALSSSAYLPTFGGVFHLSPSIASPEDGSVSESGTITLSGTAEPSSSIWVYEVGDEPEEGTPVTADAEGAWSLTVEELAVGVHVFSALAQSGSKVPANTVEVEVVPPRPHAPDGGAPPDEPSGTPASGSGTPQAGSAPQSGQVVSGLGLQAVLGGKEAKAGPPVPDAEPASTTLHVGPSGTFELPVSCPATESHCIGTIALRTLDAVTAGEKGHGTGRQHAATPLGLASGSFDVAGGQTKQLTLHLSKRVRTLLARKRLWQARATLLAHDPAGASHITRATIELLLAAAPSPSRR